jgi:predicted phosphodiesterase
MTTIPNACTSKRPLRLYIGIAVALLLVGVVVATVVVLTGKDDKGDPQGVQDESSSDGDQNESDVETYFPTSASFMSPSMLPSLLPSLLPSNQPSEYYSETVFFVIADLPYDDDEMRTMSDLIATVPESATFLVHLGDLKSPDSSCADTTLEPVAEILKESLVPVFMIVGDNEYNDCDKPTDALEQWRTTFSRFDQFWTHDLNVTTMEGRSEALHSLTGAHSLSD